MGAKLSVVATPIGNLEDITLRALRVLKEADVVACEDTRVTKKLLSHYDIHTPTTSYQVGAKARPNDRAHSVGRGFEKILKLLEDGKHVALVSDAGTPGISDPGLELVSLVRESFTQQQHSEENGLAERSEENRGHLRKHVAVEVAIEAIPGPSALAAAVSISGLRAASFTFYGFLPHKKGRETLFKEIASSERAGVFYESPHRILKTLESLKKALPKSRRVGIFREITKMFEESIVGSAAEVLSVLENDTNKQRGEFVVIVEGD